MRKTSPKNTTGCNLLDEAGVSGAAGYEGVKICLECERPVSKCPLYMKSRRGKR